jgi:PncC family amidohydrolase
VGTTDEVTRSDPPSGGSAVVPTENLVVDRLVDRGWTVAVAESLTGGEIASRLCSCPGVEGRVLGGVVSYSTDAKRTVLGVQADAVVSETAAIEMACGVRQLFHADVGLGLTGVAGPERQDDQPVGTVFVGWALPGRTGVRRLSCAGTPEQIRRAATEESLRILLEAVGGEPP